MRRSNIKIHGIPEIKSQTKSEEITKIKESVRDLITNTMKIPMVDIENCYRIGNLTKSYTN
jgi:hypothetical protein